MNKRLRDFEKESGLDIYGLGARRDKWEKALEKYAELIVRECAMIVEGFEITQEVALDEYVDYEASSVLKEHFGVKE